MTKVTIDKVFTKQIETQRGARLSVGLKVKDSSIKDINDKDIAVNDRWINGFFDTSFVVPFKQGDTVELLIIEKDGKYLNFSIPGVGKPPAPDMGLLIDRIKKLEDAVFGARGTDTETEEPEL